MRIRVLASSVLIIGLLFNPAWSSARSPVVTGDNVDQAPADNEVRGVALGSAAAVKPAVDAAVGKRVRRILAGRLNPQNEPVYQTAAQLQSSFGTSDLRRAENEQMASVEVLAPREIREDSRQAIPFGLAGMVWGVTHPSQSWRLLLPIPTAPPSVEAASRNLAQIQECDLPCR